MEWFHLGIISFVFLLILLTIGLPVAFSLAFVSTVMMYFFWGLDGLINIATTAYTTNANFLLIAIPLFILMGECITVSGMAKDAFKMVDTWFGWVPGGIPIAAVVSSTIFGAVTGFAPATCSALGPAIIPEIIRRKNDTAIGIGAIAGGAGLAIIIPPSILMIIYAFLTEVSVGRLFYSGLIPGVIISCIFITYVLIRVTLNPKLAPRAEKTGLNFRKKVQVSVYILPLIGLIFLVLGSIWIGAASPSEAAALGAFGSIILIVYYRKFSWEMVKRILHTTVAVNCMVMFILIGGTLFTQVIVQIGFASGLANWVTSLAVSRWIILAIMQLVIIILGCLLDPSSILFIVIPIFLPIVKMLEFDLYWFGIITMINCGIATITPPVGLVLYILKGVSPREIRFQDIIRGSMPYWFLYIVGMLPIIFFPELVHWLPNMIIK